MATPRSAYDDLGISGRKGDWLRPLAGVTMLAVLAAVGVWAYDRVNRQKAAEQVVAHIDSFSQQIANEERWLAKAILERRVILGMTPREVRLAKGEPRTVLKAHTLPDAHRSRGAVESWIYPFRDSDDETATVLFGVRGQVIYSRDVAGLKGEGYAIRQR